MQIKKRMFVAPKYMHVCIHTEIHTHTHTTHIHTTELIIEHKLGSQ